MSRSDFSCSVELCVVSVVLLGGRRNGEEGGNEQGEGENIRARKGKDEKGWEKERKDEKKERGE